MIEAKYFLGKAQLAELAPWIVAVGTPEQMPMCERVMRLRNYGVVAHRLAHNI
jgi:hypothetical protein